MTAHAARRAAAACLAAAIGLAGCAGGGRAPDATPAGAGTPAAERGDTASAAPARDDAPADDAAAGAPAETASLPPVDDDPDQFLGLDGPAVKTRLGAPVLVRRDGSAEVWQYRGPGCLVDLFLYTGEAEPLTVRHVDIRSPAKTKAERRDCLAEMLRAAQHRPATS